MASNKNLENREQAIALLDIYENLLTDNQKKIVSSYYRFDLSLAEIGEIEHISRAAVSDCLNKSLNKLEETEKALGLVKLKEEGKAKLEQAMKSDNKEKAYKEVAEEILNGI